MKQQVTDAIVLRRVNYGEADRIVTLLTPSDGKLALVARGVRRPKSKLAGGIELLSISSVTYAGGRSGGLGTLVSARLEQHFGNIVKDLARVQLGYELLQTADKITEDQPEPEYFTLLATGLAALNMPDVPADLIKVWFGAGLLRLAGLTPNLITDTEGQRLELERTYNFEYDSVCFTPGQDFTADHIKVLRLLFSGTSPAVIGKVEGIDRLSAEVSPLVTMLQSTLQ